MIADRGRASKRLRGLPAKTFAVVLAAVLLFAPSVTAFSPTHTGYAAYYRKGLMERVARNRRLPVVACMVASPHQAIGTWVTVQSVKRGTVLKCRVTDIPKRRHRPALHRKRIVIELDYRSNTLLCPRRAPPRACPVIVKTLRK